MLLTACGTVNGPAPVAERGGVTPPVSTAPPTTASTPPAPPSIAKPEAGPGYTLKRGGGYYKDDGPGDYPPEGLDSIPDAVPKAEPLHRFANNPYTVFGRDYKPLQAAGSYRERGLASWYGRRFHGQKTSTGETYDMYAMTAAHPTLPLPSYARVTSLANGKSVVVRVNDRGPFHDGRIIDLSYTAASKLGIVNGGSGKVEVVSLAPGEDVAPLQLANNTEAMPPPPVAAPGVLPEIDDAKGSWLQLGAFGNRDNAEALRSHLSRELDADMTAKLVVRDAGKVFRVQLGPWADAREARTVADRLAAQLDMRPILVRR